ncbi:MAG: methylenetetrahydrofolate reductase, partial [Anderseniella sp.]|nr:methylenetetrahydrofolate reductase [Anderseniella sp.]
DWRADRLAKKVAAGADFIQTNYIFDIEVFRRFMERVRDMGLDEKVFILAGVGPLASAKSARWMRNNVPGIHIPDAVIDRLEKAEKPGEEGKKLCIDLIQQIREIARKGNSADRQRAVYKQALDAGADKQEAMLAVVDSLIEETIAGLDE